ncbi:putative regulatory protein, FmdB family [Azospira oryzae PS]|uniref:Putative regulatory protein, FmdB family n=1 Tax=Azospira oryzae (strain ATCC BAA-33 / DSM 13638 / PS) TaxID=640081 RepID=G8QMD9_AZOOP|nr:zinc ribbon domain-containing protein [Azospira oryzae]AEV25717.1 putative regulatory protein, FmdB family [Azospira oryzae PS]
MPIYEYRCPACGHQQDHMQKMSDAPLTACPQCGKDGYAKQISAAGFQLKGSGWYATDFKGGSGASPASSKKSDNPPPCQGGDGACACAGS